MQRIQTKYGIAYLNRSGYYVIKQSNGYEKPLHRIIMEESLGRNLKRTEQIHHKNGKRTDNRLVNLQVVTKSAHATLHRAYRDKKRGGKKYRFFKCILCGEVFARLKSSLRSTGSKPKYCSRSCSSKSRKKY